MDAFLLYIISAVLGAWLLLVFSRLITPSPKTRNDPITGKPKKVNDLPGPPGVPLLGNLPEIARKGYHLCHLQWMRTYGTLFKYRMGPITVVIVADPTIVREVSMSKFKVFHDRPVPPSAAPTTDRGLLFATGNYWAGLRASLNPHFHNESQVSLLYPHMLKCCSAMMSKLELLGSATAPGQPILADVLPLVEEAALDAIGMSCFGEEQWQKELFFAGREGSVKAAALYSELERLSGSLGASTQLLLLLCPQVLRPLLRSLLCLVPGIPIRRSMIMRAALFHTWEERLEAWKSTSQEAAERDGKDKHHSLVSSLLQAHVKGTQTHLTDSDMTAALFNLIGAGSGTTATTVACALHFLAADPSKQERVASEVNRAILQHQPEVPSEALAEESLLPPLKSLSQMQYLDAVVKETLRLCPPGALLARKPKEDAELGGYLIPADTPVLAPIYAMHRYEGYFASPDEFVPERFIDAEPSEDEAHSVRVDGQASMSIGVASGAYLPFGLGPRMCLGQKYAMIECKLFLAAVLLKYTLELAPGKTDLNMVAGINLKPEHGVRLLFARREP